MRNKINTDNLRLIYDQLIFTGYLIISPLLRLYRTTPGGQLATAIFHTSLLCRHRAEIRAIFEARLPRAYRWQRHLVVSKEPVLESIKTVCTVAVYRPHHDQPRPRPLFTRIGIGYFHKTLRFQLKTPLAFRRVLKINLSFQSKFCGSAGHSIQSVSPSQTQ